MMMQNALWRVAPELGLAMMASFILLINLYLPKFRQHFTYLMGQVAILAAAILTAWLAGEHLGTAFEPFFVLDEPAIFLKICLLLCMNLVWLYSRQAILGDSRIQSEYWVLSLFALCGMMVMVSASHFLSAYLGLELLALPLYAMVVMISRPHQGSEAAVKYFVMGALASGLMLYGMSLIYGGTQSLNFVAVANAIAMQSPLSEPLIFGLLFIVAGLAFKLGAVPFHMWVPDVYQGAPLTVTLFIATAPKLAALGMLWRILKQAFPAAHLYWGTSLLWLGLASVMIGNLLALGQNNIKRLLAYSAIGQIGFVLLALGVGFEQGFSQAFFYMVVYLLMGLCAFGGVLALSSEHQEAELLIEFQGLSKRSPYLAAIFLLVFLSLAGVPPTLGFYAKLMVLKALVDQHQLWVASLALVFSVVAAFYYLKVIKTMYFEEPARGHALNTLAGMSWSGKCLLAGNGILLLALGLLPGGLIEACSHFFH